ncbi:MAG TPA: FliA/WhiG family RNA polymerase sigma factor [Candidatus Sulfotelmatobacter sp.]|jgi:RNA polymerase sigma factor for flagellar operon FliA|nr:FliA/WhiG family RNA polymerase sigma factor [Candidatus Sulfotelmatobacter sp.]
MNSPNAAVLEQPAKTNPAWGVPLETKTSAPNAQVLWKRYHQQHTDTEIENELVQKYMPLVSSVMGRLAMTLPEHVSQDDLYSAGLVGLLQALRNFDPACNTSFETYARVRVRGAMLDELRRMDWVPRTIHEKARRLKGVLLELEQKLGRTPTEAQMAKAMKLTAAEYQELLDEIRPAAFVCLDAVSSSDEGEGGALYEIIADAAGDNPMECVSTNELKQVVAERLKDLPDMQRKVLALYYIEDMHLREIAEVFGLTESRICQIHAQAIIGLRAFVQRFESGLTRQATTTVSA